MSAKPMCTDDNQFGCIVADTMHAMPFINPTSITIVMCIGGVILFYFLWRFVLQSSTKTKNKTNKIQAPPANDDDSNSNNNNKPRCCEHQCISQQKQKKVQ
jgi:hypothetical protein